MIFTATSESVHLELNLAVDVAFLLIIQSLFRGPKMTPTINAKLFNKLKNFVKEFSKSTLLILI